MNQSVWWNVIRVLNVATIYIFLIVTQRRWYVDSDIILMSRYLTFVSRFSLAVIFRRFCLVVCVSSTLVRQSISRNFWINSALGRNNKFEQNHVFQFLIFDFSNFQQKWNLSPPKKKKNLHRVSPCKIDMEPKNHMFWTGKSSSIHLHFVGWSSREFLNWCCFLSHRIHIWYIYLPGTQMTIVLIGKGLVLESWPSKIEDIWVPGTFTIKINHSCS